MDDVKESANKPVDMSSQGVLEVPNSIDVNTDHLDISGNKLKVLGENLARLTNLTGLEAYTNELGSDFKTKATALTPMVQLTKLKAVNLYNNKLAKLTSELGGLADMEEFNISGNKLMQVQDGAFAQWSKLKVLNLYSNNLVMIGSEVFTPLVSIEEVRLYENKLEKMPDLKADSYPSLTIFEIHKNNIKEIADDYFTKTPALERLNLYGQAAKLTNLPSSITSCASLKGLQAQENGLEKIPAGPWPETLETLFLQDNPLVKEVPASLAKCPKLLRVNIGGLQCKDDAEMKKLEAAMQKIVMSQTDDSGRPNGIIWGLSGQKL
uniref:Uncharacterized protein n=1 Tax=Haptolina brevifila TaxID=156173 RepID=A0A7S2CLL7_9EUKA